MDDSDILYDFARDLVVVASAGTGKTHALVGVLVHLFMGATREGNVLRPPVDPSRVMATTFSRKAAAEIRGRLALELERLVNGEEKALYRETVLRACDRAGVARWGDRELAERARRALDGIGRAHLGTLHSHATSLVRTYALELGLSPGFDFAEELQSRERTWVAVSRVLDAHAAAGDEALQRLVAAAGGVDRLVEQIVHALDRLSEDGRGARDLAVDLTDAREVERTMQTLTEHARALEGDRLLGNAAAAFLAAIEAGDGAGVVGAATAVCGIAARGAKSSAAEAFFAFRASLPGSTNVDRGRKLGRLWLARGRIGPTAIAARSLLVECEDAVASGAVRDCVLGFGDVLRAARNLLRDRPDIAAEVSEGLDALLVDEFQDTSRLQREIVELLWQRDPLNRAPGALASIARVRPRGLLVVGDRKQSIYGFRGADVAVFAELCVGLAGVRARHALGIAAGEVWEPEEPLADFIALQHNRRGRSELLQFANAYSSLRLRPAELPPELFEIDYVPATEDLWPPPDQPPPVASVPRTMWMRVPVREGALCSTRLDEAMAIARRVVAVVQDGSPAVRGAPPQWRDIAVLALRHETLDATAYALARAGVPYVVAGKGFYSAREVRDLAAMLGLLLNPGDKLALLEVLRGPWAGLHDESLLGLTDAHAGLAELSNWDVGDRRVFIHDEDRGTMGAVQRVVQELRAAVDRLGPADLLREAVRALAYEEVLIQLPRGEQRVANVRKLLAIAERASSSRALLAWLDRAARGDAPEAEAATFSEEDDAVRLLTVHASKGLDFPIVFLPEVGAYGRSGDRGSFAVTLGAGNASSTLSVRIADEDGAVFEPPSYLRAQSRAGRRESAERARLAYVAATRASEAMFFVGDRKPPNAGSSDAFRHSTAGALTELVSDEGKRAAAKLAVEETVLGTDSLANRGPVAEWTPMTPRAIGVPAWRSLPIATTAVQDFDHCPRRFQLSAILEMPEPFGRAVRRRDAARTEAGGDAKAEGSLVHRVLERVDLAFFGRMDTEALVGAVVAREGVPPDDERHARLVARVVGFFRSQYARRIIASGAEVRREQPFVLRLVDGQDRSLVLRGSIDLLVLWPDKSVDVVDYKRARVANPVQYALQLDAYALAALEIVPAAASVRAGLVFLGADTPEPVWRHLMDVHETRARIAAIGNRLVAARWTDRFERVLPSRCDAIRCGYVDLCHPHHATQLSLF
jgi:ATP-dependent helicase/nuclease subunit A